MTLAPHCTYCVFIAKFIPFASSWSEEDFMPFLNRFNERIDMAKKMLGRLLFSDKKQMFGKQINAFLQNPYPLLDSIIDKDKIDELLVNLVKTLLPRDPTGKTGLLEQTEILGHSYMLDYQQAS